ncbi:aminotransferase class IV [Balneola sp. MJW-20]|uniref:aminotransferase class IV n=1 Tax=Gracilimonas aurantiaca TaxID=3234185 RepID=UPI003465D031
MPVDEIIILNGKMVESDDACISPLNRGQMYGDGCFDTLRGYDGYYFALPAHYDRLRDGLNYLGIRLSFSSDEFAQMIEDLVSKNKMGGRDVMIRTQCWRKGGRGYSSNESDHDWMIQCSPVTEKTNALRLDFLTTPCIPDAALSRKYKWTNGLNYIIAAREAALKGFEDGIMLSLDGDISETTIANVFWVEGDEIFTPSEACDLLPGITRSVVIELIREAGYELNTGKFGKEEVHNAEAFFCTNALMGIRGVSTIGYREFNADHPVIRKLQMLYDKKVRNESL